MRIHRRWISVGMVAPSLAMAGMLGWFAASGQEPAGAPPEVDEQLIVGQRALVDNCLYCHSIELIEGQRLTRAQWEAEIKKMAGWGSPVAPEQTGPLLEYLVSRYSDGAPAYEPGRIAPASIESLMPVGVEPIEGHPERGQRLHTQHCATCHGPDALGLDLGPSLVEKPILLRVEAYKAILHDGRNRMPGFRMVLKPDEAMDILAWLRSRRWP